MGLSWDIIDSFPLGLFSLLPTKVVKNVKVEEYAENWLKIKNVWFVLGLFAENLLPVLV